MAKNIDILQDNRPYYILDTDVFEYTITNVTSIQNLKDTNIRFFDEEDKLIILLPYKWVVWDEPTTVKFNKTGYKITVGLR